VHNEELCNLYASHTARMIKSIRIKWTDHIARTGEMRNTHKILVRRPERKRSLTRTKCRCEDNIRIDPREIGCKRCGLNSSVSG
jgi:hypothetical protein